MDIETMRLIAVGVFFATIIFMVINALLSKH